MKRLAFALSLVPVATTAWFGVLGGCGQLDNFDTTDADTDVADVGMSDSNTMSPWDAELEPAEASAVPPLDGGSDAPPWKETDNVPNPGKITCGAEECDAGLVPNFSYGCCVQTDGGRSCGGQACVQYSKTIGLWCDEPADCPTSFFKPTCCLTTGFVRWREQLRNDHELRARVLGDRALQDECRLR